MSEGGNDDSPFGRLPGDGPVPTVLAVFEDPAPRTAREVAEATDQDPETVAEQLDALAAAGRLGHKTVGGEDPVKVWYPTPGGNGSSGTPLDGLVAPDTGADDPDGGGDDGASGHDGGDDLPIDRIPDPFEESDGPDADHGSDGPGPTGGTDDAGSGRTGGKADGEDDDGDDGTAGEWNLDGFTIHGSGPTPTRGDRGGVFEEVDERLAEFDVPGTSEMMREWRRGAVRAAFEHLHAEGEARSAAIVEAVYPGHRAGYADRGEWWDYVAPMLAALPGVERDGDRWAFVGPDRSGGR